MIMFFVYTLGLFLIAFIIFVIFKQIQFYFLAIDLYREMVANQKEMLKSLKEMTVELNWLSNSARLNPPVDNVQNQQTKPQEVKTLKEIKL